MEQSILISIVGAFGLAFSTFFVYYIIECCIKVDANNEEDKETDLKLSKH